MKRKDFLKTCLAVPAAIFGAKLLPAKPVFWGKGVPEILADHQAVMNEAARALVSKVRQPGFNPELWATRINDHWVDDAAHKLCKRIDKEVLEKLKKIK